MNTNYIFGFLVWLIWILLILQLKNTVITSIINTLVFVFSCVISFAYLTNSRKYQMFYSDKSILQRTSHAKLVDYTSNQQFVELRVLTFSNNLEPFFVFLSPISTCLPFFVSSQEVLIISIAELLFLTLIVFNLKLPLLINN
jgi:hypothetical protein